MPGMGTSHLKKLICLFVDGLGRSAPSGLVAWYFATVWVFEAYNRTKLVRVEESRFGCSPSAAL